MARPHRQIEERQDVFAALAEPSRRRALELLTGGEKSVQDLARHFSMTLAAVSQHLQILHAAGLVKRREEGRRRLYALDRAGFASVRNWLDDIARFWDGALDRLEAHFDEEAKR